MAPNLPEIIVVATYQMRKILSRQDARGMTFLMYAVNPEAMLTRPIIDAANLLTAEQGLSEELLGKRHSIPLCLTQSAPFSTELDANGGEGPRAARSVVEGDPTQEYNANPWVPVVKSVLGFAKKNLWMPEVGRWLHDYYSRHERVWCSRG